MSFDLKAICDALAAKYAKGTIATPSGATAMRKSYGQMPISTPVLPAVVVVPQDGEVILDSGAWHGDQHIDVVLLLNKQGDTRRPETERQRWLPALINAVWADMDLGLAPDVAKAYPTGWEFAEYPYQGNEYDAVIVHFTVAVRITQAMAA